MRPVKLLSAALLLAGCSSYSSAPTTTVLPTSNRSIDVVLHRGDVRLMDCATLAVLQTYNATGSLIDSKEAHGTALHCTVLPALIDAGGRVGAAAAMRPAITQIKNTVTSAIANSQTQSQGIEWNGGNVTSTNTNNATGGAGGSGGAGGGGGGGGGSNGQGGQGNNGGGNGGGDGTNPGTGQGGGNGGNTEGN